MNIVELLTIIALLYVVIVNLKVSRFLRGVVEEKRIRHRKILDRARRSEKSRKGSA